MKNLLNEVYTSPVTDVVDLCGLSVFCASGGTQKYDVNDYSDGWSDKS